MFSSVCKQDEISFFYGGFWVHMVHLVFREEQAEQVASSAFRKESPTNRSSTLRV